MGFLVPVFLAGLAALGVPVWIHLRHRERKGAVPFPSLMFLRTIPFREVRRQRLHHLPLLLLRAALVALAVLAFARPLIRRGATLVPAAGRAREAVILLDRSYSMGYGTRWGEAVAAARAALDGLAPEDRATVVLFDEEPVLPLEPGAPVAAWRAVLDTLHPSFRGTRFAPALKVAQDLLAASANGRRQLTLISDFQRVGWPQREEIALPAGTAFERVVIGTADRTDHLIHSVEWRRDGSGDRVVLTARLVARGTATSAVRATLRVNDRTMETRPVTLSPDRPALVTFAPVDLTLPHNRASVALDPADALARNDTFSLVLARERRVQVLILGAGGERDFFLRRVLGVSGRPALQVTYRERGPLSDRDLAGADLLIVHDAPLTGAQGARVARRVEAGMGLLLLAGAAATDAAWPESIRPARVGLVIDRTEERGGTLGGIDRSHPLFEPFQGSASGDFSGIRFLRYRDLAPLPGAAVLGRFDDGRPALVERMVGRGRVLAVASPADNLWNDLPVQPAFLPFVHQMMIYLAGYREAPVAYRVGEFAPLVRGDSATPVIVNTPSGERLRIAPGSAADGGAGGAFRLLEPGIYRVVEAGPGGRDVAMFGVNVDRVESDLTPLDPEELAVAIGAGVVRTARADRGAPAPDAAGADPRSARAIEARQRLWWYLLAAALLVAAAETVVGNRTAPVARSSRQESVS